MPAVTIGPKREGFGSPSSSPSPRSVQMPNPMKSRPVTIDSASLGMTLPII